MNNKKRIEELERRVRELEARPPLMVYQPIYTSPAVPWYVREAYTPQFYPYTPTVTITKT
jgi:hypothetical protein